MTGTAGRPPDPDAPPVERSAVDVLLKRPFMRFTQMIESRIVPAGAFFESVDSSFSYSGEHGVSPVVHKVFAYAAVGCYATAGAFMLMRTLADGWRPQPVQENSMLGQATPRAMPRQSEIPAASARAPDRMPYLPWSKPKSGTGSAPE